mgnify:CR=1 FL=1
MENEQPSVGQSVLAFYRVLPFNYRQSVAEHADEIKSRNAILSYPVLPPLLEKPDMRVLEIGWNIASPYASASEGPRGGGLPGPPGVTPV